MWLVFNMISQFPNIVCTDEVLNGSPRINGRRLAVGDVISLLNNYGTFDEVTGDFELNVFEIKQALNYCSSLQCKLDKPKVFCHNCSLRRQQEGPLDISNAQELKTGDTTIGKNDNIIYLGSLEELLDDWQGRDWWKVATELLIDLRDILSKGRE